MTSFPLLAAIGISVLIFDPILRVTSLFGIRRVEYVAVLLQRFILQAFKVCNVRVEVEAAPGFDDHARYVFVSNHQSNFDIPLIGAELYHNRPKFVANRSLVKGIPTVSFLLRFVGHGTIDPARPREALRDIRDYARRVAEIDASATIFPEGRRARDGVLGEFRPAGTSTLLKTLRDLPVVPIAIDGAWFLMLHGLLPTPWGTRVRVYVGEPIGRDSKSPDEILEECRGVVAAKLDEWRSTGHPH